MKNIHISFLTAALLVLICTYQTNAQVTLQIGAGLGYSTPTGDYGGNTTEFYNGTKYGIESGFNYHAKARVGLLFLNVFGEIGYTTFSGEGEATPGQGNIKLSNNVFSMKVGPEFPITIPLSPITPYLMAFVAVNTFSGQVEFQGVSSVPSGTYDLASATRVGIGGGGGVTFSAGPLKLDLNIQYHLINFTGNEYKIENVTSHARLDNYTSLNDGADPAYVNGSDSHFIKDDRGIGAMEFKVTAMFGL
jgi:Outer membrane protein beta-barrel domain